MKHTVLRRALMTSAAGAALAATAAGEFTWSAAGEEGYSGSIADPAHWGLDSGYPGSGYPDTGRAGETMVFPGGVGDYTVTFPAGESTTMAGFRLGVSTGETITFDVSGGTWRLPDLSGLSLNYPLRELLSDGGNTFLRFQTDARADATPIPLTLDGTIVRYSSQTEAGPGTVLSFEGGAVTVGNTSPYELLVFSGRWGSFAGDAHGSASVLFSDTDFSCNGLKFGFTSPTNVLAVSGGSFVSHSLMEFAPYHAPVAGNDVPGVFSVAFSDGCEASIENLKLGYDQGSYQSGAKNFRLCVTNGAHPTLGTLECNCPGRHDVLFSGSGTTVSITNIHFAAKTDATAATARVEVVDGAYFKAMGTIMLGGGENSRAELVVSNATLESRNVVLVANGRFSMLDGAYFPYGNDHKTWLEGAGGPSAFHADGGLVAVTHYSPNADGIILGFGTATLGAGGLVVDVGSNAGEVYLPQNFEDAAGAEGHLVLRRVAGSRSDHILLGGTDSCESHLDIALGKIVMAEGANHRSHVTVTNGATLSMAGAAASMAVRSLTLGNAVSSGTLALDPGDVIELAGPLRLERAVVSFSSDLPAGTNTVFRSTVEPSEATVTSWETVARASVSSGLPSDKYSVFRISEDGGVWLFQIIVGESRQQLTGETGWQGSGGAAAWTEPSNWSPAVPTMSDRAVFSSDEPSEITVSGTVDVGAVRLSNADHELSGGTIRVSDNAGAALEVLSGHQEISSVLRLGAKTAVSVSEGASLTLSGRIIGGGLAKSGTGALTLSAFPNILPEGFSLSGGTMTVASPACLGSASESVVSGLSGGTLVFGSGGVLAAKTQVSGPVVYLTHADVEMPFPSSTGGAVIKRGAGRLTMTVDDSIVSAMTPYPADFSMYSSSDAVSFPADGSAPAKYAPLTICSGPFVLKGTSSAVPSVTFQNQILSLAPPPAEGEPVPAPEIVVDHAELKSLRFFAADGVTDPDAFDGPVRIDVRNGGILNNDELRLSNQGVVPVAVSVDNGAVRAFMEFNNSGNPAVTNRLSFINGSRLVYTSHRVYGSTIAVFTNSVFAGKCGDISDRATWSGCSIDVRLSESTAASFVFSGGSVFACKSLKNSDFKPFDRDNLELTFDGSEWYPGSGDFCLVPSNLNTRIVVTGGGLRLCPAAGERWTLLSPVTGDGGLVKEGEGTLHVARRVKNGAETADPVTLACSGVNDIRAGVLSIGSGAASTGLVFRVAGTLDAEGAVLGRATLRSAGGTLRNVTLNRPLIGFDADAAPAPMLFDGADGCSLTGRVTVDFGRAPDDPLELDTSFTVARWGGVSAPDLRRWRGTGLGKDRSCRFSSGADGAVVATVGRVGGLTVIVR